MKSLSTGIPGLLVVHFNPYLAVPSSLLIILAAYVWWSLRTKVNTKSKWVADLVLLWPLILRGRRTSREKVAMVVGVVIAALLICLSLKLRE